MRITVAFRAFFASLFNSAVADRLERVLAEKETTTLLLEPESVKIEQEKSKPKSPLRQSEAITLLAAMQREARFIDFIQEPISEYTDAQIGAAARSVHDESAKVLRRFFALEPVVNEPEESQIEVDPKKLAQFQLVGNVGKMEGASEKLAGKLAHPGWKATQLEIPQWTGEPDAAMIVAPAEIII